MAKRRKKKDVEYYKIRGKVVKIGDERTVESRWGKESTVVDVTLKTEKGTKVRISFWNEDPEFDVGDKVLITYITDQGAYKGTKQYSTSSDTEVKVLESGEEDDDEDSDDAEPAEPADEVEDPEEAEDDEDEKPRKRRKSKKSRKSNEDALDRATTYVSEVVEKAVEVVDELVPDKIAKDAQAYQAFFATVFIALKDQRYFMSKED